MNKNKKLIFAKNTRKNILQLSYQAKSSHIGSCFSIIEILTILYNDIFKNYSKKNIKKYKNQFILSKGHACLALYCVLYEKKIINKKTLQSYGSNNSLLMSHVSHHVPGVDFSTGSLGHGLPVATGIALSLKSRKINKKTFVLISDGELNEGTTWESILFACHHKLNNLIIIIDYNKLQSLTFVKNTLNIEPLNKKFSSFGCKVFNINGHNYKQIKKALSFNSASKPIVIIANTIKGRGVSFMENNIEWHYKSPNLNQLKTAIKEINNA
ncbi:MAG: transketolase [Pelagibacteraceae bacterium]